MSEKESINGEGRRRKRERQRKTERKRKRVCGRRKVSGGTDEMQDKCPIICVRTPTRPDFHQTQIALWDLQSNNYTGRLATTSQAIQNHGELKKKKKNGLGQEEQEGGLIYGCPFCIYTLIVDLVNQAVTAAALCLDSHANAISSFRQTPCVCRGGTVMIVPGSSVKRHIKYRLNILNL